MCRQSWVDKKAVHCCKFHARYWIILNSSRQKSQMTKETCYSAGTELDGNSKNINMHFPNSLFNNIAGKKTLPLCLPLSGIVVLSMHVFFQICQVSY